LREFLRPNFVGIPIVITDPRRFLVYNDFSQNKQNGIGEDRWGNV